MKYSKKNKKLPFNITKHGNISSIYFNSIFDNIIKCIEQNKSNKIKILDFGCGNGYLKKRLGKNKRIKVIGYDIVKRLSDVQNWKMVNFDYFISCHVFTYFKKESIKNIITYLKKNRPNSKVIVAITRQGWLNKLGAFILNEPEAHTNFNLTPNQELKILTNYMKVKKKINIFFLTDIYVLEF
jgi:pantothenate kinase